MGAGERCSQWAEHGKYSLLWEHTSCRRDHSPFACDIQLRVWGGGIYQPSDELTGGYDFYSVCDELGIFAWSELIFSDALYPINDFLLESVEPEVRQNIRRVNRHPSNAQWAGGNEIEGIVIGVKQSLSNGTHYLDEVRALQREMSADS